MPEPNSANTGKGRSFQLAAAAILSQHFGVHLQTDHPLLIGDPAKVHKFDLASADATIVGECKNYSWTEGKNVPSAKMGFLNEAVFYLTHLPATAVRFIVMRRDLCAGRSESLADYYVRSNRHLFKGVRVLEIDMDGQIVRDVTADSASAGD